MDSIGITRKIDDLGRIVIPKEIRRNLNIKNNDELNIWVEQNSIILQKYKYNKTYQDLASKICNIIDESLNMEIVITNTEEIIAASNSAEIVNKKISENLLTLIKENRSYVSSEKESLNITIDKNILGYFTIMPVITSIDTLGLLIVVSQKNVDNLNICKLITKILTEKIDIY